MDDTVNPLSLKILNGLRLGRVQGAEIPARREGFRAWIYVVPVPGERDYLVRNVERDPQCKQGFVVGHVEVAEENLYGLLDFNYPESASTFHEQKFVCGEHMLARYLMRKMPDLNALRHAGVPEYLGMILNTMPK